MLLVLSDIVALLRIIIDLPKAVAAVGKEIVARPGLKWGLAIVGSFALAAIAYFSLRLVSNGHPPSDVDESRDPCAETVILEVDQKVEVSGFKGDLQITVRGITEDRKLLMTVQIHFEDEANVLRVSSRYHKMNDVVEYTLNGTSCKLLLQPLGVREVGEVLAVIAKVWFESLPGGTCLECPPR